MDKKFNVGDKVKFKEFGRVEKLWIPNYFTADNGIPGRMISHGNREIDKDCYLKDFMEIKDIYEEFYIVAYKDIDGREVRLGFKEDFLEIVYQRDEIEPGDSVVIDVPRDHQLGLLNGRQGKVVNKHIEKTIALVRLELEDKTSCSVKEDEIQLIEKSKIKPPKRFKIGEKARIFVPMDHPYYSHNGKEIEIGEVSYFWDDKKTVKDLYIGILDGKEIRFTEEELEESDQKV